MTAGAGTIGGGLRERIEERALLALLLLAVAALSVVPLARLVVEAFTPGGQPSLAAFARELGDATTWAATRNSLIVALGGTLLAALLGSAVALVVALTDVRARNAFVFLFVMPLMIAPQVVALAWLTMFGPSSTLLHLVGLAPPPGSRNPLYSPGGVVLLLGVQYAPLVFLALRAGLRAMPGELIEAGLAGGGGPWRVLWRIVLPLMTPPLVAGVALAFVSCLGNFGIPAFLGIPGGFLVLPTLIYQRLAGLGTSVLADVSVLSILVGVIAIGGLRLQDAMLKRRDFRITAVSNVAATFELGRWRLPVEVLLWTLAFLMIVMPIVSLALTSLVPAVGVKLTSLNATLDNYRFVLTDHDASRRAFRNSLGLSVTASATIALFAIPLAYFLVWRHSRVLRAMAFFAEMPYALPGVVVAIAAILVFLKPLPLLGFTLYNTVWIILFCYLARFLVLGLRPVISGFHQLDRTLEEAAQITGARLLRRLRTVILPLVAPAAAAGALLIFLTAFNELTVSALLWSSGSETLGVVLFSFQQAGDATYASALAMLTIALSVALMLSTLLFAGRVSRGVIPWRD